MILQQGFRAPRLQRPWLAVSSVVLVLVDILVALFSSANVAVWASALVYLSLLIAAVFGSEFGWLPIVSCCLIMWVTSEPQLAYAPYACLLVLGMWGVERKYLSLLVGVMLFDISVIGNSSNFEMSAISMIVINVVMVAVAWAIGQWRNYSLELERRLRLLEVVHRQAHIAAQQRAVERLHSSVAKDISHALISMRILKLEAPLPAEDSRLADCEQILSRAAKDLRSFMVAMWDDTGAALAALEGDLPVSKPEPLLALLRSAQINADVEISRLYAVANRLPPGTWRACWQLLDEGVVNICKYGKRGGAALVFAAVMQEGVVIELTNEVSVVSRRGDAASSTGLGLQAIKRQVEHIGGTCDWERRRGKWMLRACIPVEMSSETQP